jgi:SET domain-containing protein
MNVLLKHLLVLKSGSSYPLFKHDLIGCSFHIADFDLKKSCSCFSSLTDISNELGSLSLEGALVSFEI